MINPKELRLGNFLRHLPCPRMPDGLEVEIVNSLDERYYINGSDCDNDGLCEFEYYDPIPLTEEWLVRFGFSDEGCYGWFSTVSNDDFEVVKEEDMWMLIDEVAGKERPLTHFEYVHQLQNLYAVLTGEELVLK